MGRTSSSVKFKMIQAQLVLQLSLSILFSTTVLAENSKVHIVYMGRTHSHLPSPEVTAVHHTMLASTMESADSVQDSMIYSYTNAFSGFAAKLSPEQVSKLSQMDGVLSVLPNKALKPQTTHSWNFLGLELPDCDGIRTPEFSNSQASVSPNLWSQAKYGEDIIVGMVDTGIWPESESFNDDGLSDIPARWKGACAEGQNFTPSNCNKKVIGAKWFVKGFEAEYGNVSHLDILSARDVAAHGTHTASTAGGRIVANVSANGFANGTAKGGAPSARIAAYKVCWLLENSTESPCSLSDLLAAMDEAVKDGVDLISISIGGPPPPNLFQDGMGISAFHAMERGILVVFAGGNTGPTQSTVDHLEPWSLTVGASTIDRTFPATLKLGNSITLQGVTITEYDTLTADLVSAEDLVADGQNTTLAAHCMADTLDAAKTKGKIVFCLRGLDPRGVKGMVVKSAGAIGMILGNEPQNGDDVTADNHVLPALDVSAAGAQEVAEYIKNSSNPTATLFKGLTSFGEEVAPAVAGFSSVGPNLVTADILKPDITAPGLNILAAWSGGSSPTLAPGDDRRVAYNIISGTSMAAPHVAGVVALLKVIHPDWSPAALKSALMTTAVVLDNKHSRITNSLGEPATPFQGGAGNMDPNAAAHPGLVYNASTEDYTIFLCSMGYNDTAVQIITGQRDVCSSQTKKLTPSDLNLPSLSVGNLEGPKTIQREVTNVDPSGSTYKVHIVPPTGVDVSIVPSTLKFKTAGEKKKFYVRTTPQNATESGAPKSFAFGSYTWYNGKRKVRSPIVVGFQA